MYLEAPTQAEIRKAVRHITTRKVQGADNIPLETLKSDIETSVKLLQPLFADIWDVVETPDDWREGLISNAAKERQHLKM